MYESNTPNDTKLCRQQFACLIRLILLYISYADCATFLVQTVQNTIT